MADSTHIVCPQCGQINRVLTPRLADAPRCGRCKQRLFTGRPVHLNQQSFDRFIEGSDLPVVVDFWAAWCAPCKMMAPGFERAAAALEPEVVLAKLDTEEAPQVARRLGIQSLPTLVVFKRGRETARQAGAMPQSRIEHWVRTQV